jgi:hypothetical protein
VFLVFLPLKGKQEKSKLSVLLFSAVNNNIQTKTHLGSQFKPPFLGVVVDYHRQSKICTFSWSHHPSIHLQGGSSPEGDCPSGKNPKPQQNRHCFTVCSN